MRKALEDANLKKTDIDEIVLVGGSTRIPKVQSLLKEYFDGKEPSKGVNPDEVGLGFFLVFVVCCFPFVSRRFAPADGAPFFLFPSENKKSSPK